jgi:pimeloyl-ACP methyl ester carboxylesterase
MSNRCRVVISLIAFTAIYAALEVGARAQMAGKRIVVVVPDSGHSPQLENAAAWLDAVSCFLDRADS